MTRPDAPPEAGQQDFGLPLPPFGAAMQATRLAMTITDPRRADNPIVFANDAFLRLTGYERSEVEGRNCRFLQGPGTDPGAAARIGRALGTGHEIGLDILNYRKDGTPFWNALSISPVLGGAGEVQYFVATQTDVTERLQDLQDRTTLLREVDHRVKNTLQMIAALVATQMKAVSDPGARETLAATLRRIEALATLHRRLHQSDDVAQVAIGAVVGDIVADLLAAAGRADIAVTLDLAPLRVPAETAAPLALIANELVTNALKHAFADRPGRLTVRVARVDGRDRLEVADDGPGMSERAPGAATFGTTIVRMLARQLRAGLDWGPAEPQGTRATLILPARGPEEASPQAGEKPSAARSSAAATP
ncbi:PAS domain-containing protein [Methylobacterium radiodurans]|uniref:Histidine kinase n=1 Tax=Methylobacterium radiodurans TaxID=2202828 RepID=A0A2U8VPS9_9HYPH|nr:PAS domain-containing protein [Methylobacterium radiodurans]AWN35392.1 histidine kinase [Methylobacterium radiodurans]